jgi:outer membrane lipopolysaccharide assembly protein LptE/RlpB
MRRSTMTVAGAAALATLLAGAGYALAQSTTTPPAAPTMTMPTDPNAAPMDSSGAMPSDSSAPAPRADRN